MSDSSTYDTLRVRLRASQYAPLDAMINWPLMPPRSVLRAYTLALLSALVVVVCTVTAGFVIYVSYLEHERAAYWTGFVGSTAWTILLGIAIAQIASTRLVLTGYRETSKFVELALFSHRAPTLYLRRFDEENPELQSLGRESRDWRVRLGATLGDALGVADMSFENALSKAVRPVGPLIALSDPQNRRETGAACRLAVRSEVWQPAVDNLLERANLVVMDFSYGTALDWEAQRVLEQTAHPFLICVARPNVDWQPAWLERLVTRSAGGVWDSLYEDRTSALFLLVPADRRTVYFARANLSFPRVLRAIRGLLRRARVAPVTRTPSSTNTRLLTAAPAAIWSGVRIASISMVLMVGWWACPYAVNLSEAIQARLEQNTP